MRLSQSQAGKASFEVVHERVAQVLRPYNFAINDVQIVSEIATCDSRWLSSVLASTLGTASSRRSGNPTRVIHVDALLPYPESDLDSVSEVEVPWIVFTDNGQTALALCKDAPASVTVVRSCPEDDETAILRASGIRVVHVNLYSPDPFSEVIAEMNQAVTLINLWTAEESPHDVIRNEGLIWGNLMRGVAGLGEALRTFAQQAIKMNRALVVTRNASDVGAQSSATLHAGMSAFVRAARAEGHPINHLDLVEGADLIQAVQDELRLQPETDRIVTGAGQRYVRALRRAELTAPTEVTTRRLSSGVVVVVGGTGGVGQWLVTVLLARYEADVLVLGRRPYHQVSSILDDVRNRSGNRGRLRYMEMDLNESTDISLAITSELDGKALAGIFYLAGAIDEVLITDSTLSRTRENYGASIISIHRIGELVKQNAGAFLAVFGSARSLSPGVTVSDYVAATEHAVRYAAYLQKLGVHAVGVSWSVWNETGMSRNLSVKKALAHRGLTAFDVLEGVNALLGALESNLGLIYYGIEDRDLDFPKVSELQPPAIQIVTDAPTASILVDRANEIDAIVAEAGGSEYIVDVLDSLPRDRFGAIDDILIDARADILRGTVQIEPPADESEARVLDVCTSVLGIPSIGVTENLFNLGADSITVIRLLGSIRNQLGLDVSHEGFYRCPTVRGLASNLKQLKIIGSVHIDEAENQFPLSPQQRRQWVLYNLNPSSGYYNNTITVTVTGTIVEPCLKAALVSLIERHEILRTRYVIVEDIPLQQVLPISGIDIDIPVLDMRHLSEFSQNQQLKQLIDTSGARPLNISSGLPLRLAIARTGQDEAVLVITIHHIASDGWSMRVILEELQQLYDDILAHGASRLPALKSQYRHHVADILAQENTDNYRRQLDYWITEMAGQSSAPPLSAASYNSSSNKESSAQNQNAGGHFTLSLDGELTANLKRLAHELDSSMYVVTLAAYAVLHARLTTDNHVRIGTLIAGRHRPETELLVGFFVNTLPVDFTVADDMTVRELVKLAKAKTITMQDNQDVQFDALVEAMQPERISDSNPLFQVLFVLQNAQLECAHGREAEWNLKIHENDTAKFDFSVQVFERPRAMDIVFEYRRDLLDAETVARWGRAYSRVLERFCAEPDTRVSDIDIVGKETGSLLFAEPAKSLLPSSLGVALAKTVRDFGERIALSKGGVALQYNELWERAGRYAGFLAENGVSEGSRVAVVARRTPEVIIALIALIRLGAVYVPLRPNDPDMRHAAIMADSGATVLLDSTEETRAGVAPLPLDEYSRDIPVEPEVTLDNPIYIMYTSGSTGTPKGVVVTHENVLSLAYQPKFIKLSCSDTTLQTGSLTFDASTFEVWGTLLAGAHLRLIDDATILDTHALSEEISRNSATIMWLSAPLFHQIIDSNPKALTGIRDLLVGGDVVSPRHVRAALDASPGLNVINGYGPTENTTFSTTYRVPASFPLDCPLPIGMPVQRSTAYILGPGHTPQLDGVVGELYVGGQGVSQGYLGHDELTAERFLPDPFVGDGGRMYRTGDLARVNAEGEIEFIGRQDHQVKIRGFRVELAEVELALRTIDGIQDAVVIALPASDGRMQLVAYHCGPRTEGVRAELEVSLPDYAIPYRFIHLNYLPLDPNGKVDRTLLPSPSSLEEGPSEVASTVSGENDIISIVRDIWKSLLDQTNFTNNESFFSLGGDSIQVIQMTNKLRQKGLVVSARDVFVHQTVEALAKVLRPAEKQSLITPVTSRATTAQLTPAQHWLLTDADADSGWLSHWNLPVAILVNSRTTYEAVCGAVDQIIAKHRLLSARFIHDGKRWHMFLPENPVQAPAVMDITVEEINEATQTLTLLQSSLDLEAGRLLAVAIVRSSDGTYVLLAPHHLVSDGVTLRILSDELLSSLEGRNEQEDSKNNSIEAWIRALDDRAKCVAEIEKQRLYWADVVRSARSQTLPVKASTFGNTIDIMRSLDSELTAQLNRVGSLIHGAEVQHVLLASLVMAWTETFGGDYLPVLLEGHGRTHAKIDVDISGEVGWFTSIYPAIISAPANRDLLKAVLDVRDHARALPNGGIDFGVLRYMMDGGEQFAINPPLAFNYLGVIPHGLRFADPEFGEFRSPDSPRSAPIELNVLQEEGLLRIVWTVEKQAGGISPELVSLIENYELTLMMLCSKLSSEQGRVYSAGDFDLVTLNENSLDMVRDRFGSNVSDILPLTPGQAGLFYHGLVTDNDDYFGQISTTFKGNLDFDAFAQAWRLAVNRHDILRTVYLWEQMEHPIQIVLDNLPFEVEYEDFTRSATDVDKEVHAVLSADITAGFDLTSGPLLRVKVCCIGEDTYLFMLSFPHLSLDGWSVFHILYEVLQDYERGVSQPRKSITSESSIGEPALSCPGFGQYVRWLAQQDTEADRRYWQNYLTGLKKTAILPAESRGDNDIEGVFIQSQVSLTSAETHALEVLATKIDCTLGSLLQVGLGLTLSLYSTLDEVVLGVTTSGRTADLPGVEDIAGMLISTVPLRIPVNPEHPIDELVRCVQTDMFEAVTHSTLSTTEISECADLPPGHNLFDVALIIENYPLGPDVLKSTTLELGSFSSHERTNFPVTVVAIPGEELLLRISVTTNQINTRWATSFGVTLRRVLLQISEGRRTVADIDASTEALRRSQRTRVNCLYEDQRALFEVFDGPVYVLNAEGGLCPPGARGRVYLAVDTLDGLPLDDATIAWMTERRRSGGPETMPLYPTGDFGVVESDESVTLVD